MKRKIGIFALAVMCFSCVCFAQDSFNGGFYDPPGSIRICLRVQGILGESFVENHVGDIDVLTWNWGMIQSRPMNLGRYGVGKTEVQDFVITKYVDRASPGLMLTCLNGLIIPEATIFVLKETGVSLVEYLVIKMQNVGITSVMAGGNQNYDQTIENVTFNFEKVTFTYWILMPDGALGEKVEFTWNVAANREG